METEYQQAPPGRRPDLLRRIVDQRGAAAFGRQRHTLDWIPQRAAYVSGLASSVLLMMVKDEEEIIVQNLKHHHALGFRRFFILDNGSTDSTAALIRSFRADHADAEVFYAYDFVVGYYQADKMKALEAFMASYLCHEDIAPEWVFFVDADEFITCCAADTEQSVQRFNDLLADPGRTMLVFHWAQCASHVVLQTLSQSDDVFTLFPVIWGRMDPTVSKVAYRLNHGLVPLQGNHMVEVYPFELDTVAVMAEAGYHMLHFPQRTVEQLRRKVVNGSRAYQATKKHEHHGGHWRTYNEWYEQHGDTALEHILSDHIKSCAAP